MSAVSSMHLFVTSIHPYILVLEQYLVRLAIASCVCDTPISRRLCITTS